jgi:outer membrane murein-binding lipoprotein Lpp
MRAAVCTIVVLALAVAGCGSKQKKTIPASNAQALLTQLDQTASNFDKGNCNGAEFDVGQLQDKANRLPSSVDPEVKTNIQNGLTRLSTLVHDNCQKPQTTTTTSSSTTSSTTPSTTITTTTSSTSTSTSTSSTSTSTSSSTGGGVVPPTGTAPSGGATSP